MEFNKSRRKTLLKLSSLSLLAVSNLYSYNFLLDDISITKPKKKKWGKYIDFIIDKKIREEARRDRLEEFIKSNNLLLNKTIYNHKIKENKLNRTNPIDAYNQAMTILAEFEDGNFNTGSKGEPYDKSRALLKALDIIGHNNVRGMYLGCKEYRKLKDKKLSKKERERILSTMQKQPPIIGRLSITIIQENGLWLG